MESGGNAELCAYQENISGQTWISIHDCPLSESTCKLLNRVVPNGTLRGVEGEGQISPIRSADGRLVFSFESSGQGGPMMGYFATQNSYLKSKRTLS